MQIVHSNVNAERWVAPKKLSKKQERQQRLLIENRRMRYRDFKAALKDPEVAALVKEAKELSPGWAPTFE